MISNIFFRSSLLAVVLATMIPSAKAADIITTQKAQTLLNTQPHSIEAISGKMLNTPYVADTLIGSSTIPEKLVINVNSVDCFTFIDDVLALYQSHDLNDLTKNMTKIRYVDGKVNFLDRKHFFSDWYSRSPQNAKDITQQISPHAVTILKHLNRKADGSEYLLGLGIIAREIHYIPSIYVNDDVINHLKTGDFIGIYTPKDGLDASHVGILIKKDNQTYFRNASSLAKNRKVVDSPLLQYIQNKPGIMVLRAQ